jgi:quinone-modifying oxidoreductase subunit QmoC
MRIEPDLQFVKELQAVGGDSLKKCYQCATCSVACPISPTTAPYPRKEMIWAQWGLKDKLMNDVDIWLCHNCGACSDLCPRGAKPGDLLAALRNMAYQKLMPGPIGKWMSAAKYLPVLIAIPAILWLVVWVIRAGQLGTAFPLTKEGKVVYGLLFPGDFTVDPIFVATFFAMVFVFLGGLKKLISSFKAEGEVLFVGEKKSWIKCLIEVVFGEIMTHKKFVDCGDDKKDRKYGHMALFYGFIFLAIVTGVVATGHWLGYNIAGWLGGDKPDAPGLLQALYHFGHATHTPMAQTNIVKVLANVGAICLLIGLGMLTFRRMSLNPKQASSSFYDWYLLGVIWVVALTGIGSELFRLANIKYLAYPTYYLHLVAVFMLFAYLPWSKLGHLVYRTAALTYANHMGRKVL